MKTDYCTLADLLERFGEKRLPLDPITGTLDTTRINAAIVDSKALINSYLPFLETLTPNSLPAFVKTLCIDIAAYRLGDIAFSQEDIVQRYEKALQRLADLQKICETTNGARKFFGIEKPRNAMNVNSKSLADHSLESPLPFQKKNGGLL